MMTSISPFLAPAATTGMGPAPGRPGAAWRGCASACQNPVRVVAARCEQQAENQKDDSLRHQKLQLVADAVDGAQPGRGRDANLLELAAQVLDVSVDRAVGDHTVVCVELLQELVAREHASGRRSEGAEKAKFNR